MAKSFLRCPCELSGNPDCSHPLLFYKGPKQPTILVIGASPSLQEDRSGKLGTSYDNRAIIRILKDNKVDTKTVGYTNVISCYLGEVKPKDYHYTPCIRKLKELLQEKAESIELIFLVGDTPLRKVLGKAGIAKNRGQIFKIGTACCVPLYSPTDCKGSKQKKRNLEWDIKRGILATKITPTKINYQMVNAEQLEKMIPEIRKAKKLTFDTETTGLEVWKDQFYVIGMGFCWDGLHNKGVFLPLEHPQLSITAEEYEKRVDVIKRVMALPVPKEAYYGEYDLSVMAVGMGMDLYDVVNYCKDPLQAFHLIDCNRSISLSNLTIERLADIAGYDTEMDIYKTKYGDGYMEKTPLEVIAEYCVGDCVATHRNGDMLEDELMDIGSYDLYNELVVPSSKIYTLLSIRGVKIDPIEATRLQKVYRIKIEELKQEILALPAVTVWEKDSKEKLSLTSATQKMKMVYDFYKIPEETAKRKDVKGKVTWSRSLDKKSVKKIMAHKGSGVYQGKVMDFLTKMQQFSLLNIIEERYTGKWKDHLHSDGLIHARLNNRGTVSGRLSVTKPNLQQMPTRIDTEDSGLADWMTENAVKKMLVSKYPDGWLVDGDYSQIELRVMAILSEDEFMVETYRDGLHGGDIHMSTALRKFPQFESQSPKVQTSLRIKAKEVNFKGTYSFDPEFLAVYPGLRDYIERIKKLAKIQGYVIDVTGRRRVISNLTLDVPNKKIYDMTDRERERFFLRESALRAAVNLTIQSPAHALLENSLLRIDARLHYMKTKQGIFLGEIIMETHDSLTGDSPDKKSAEIMGRIMKEEMERITEIYKWLTVPIIAKIEIGRNWWEMEKYEPK